MCMCKKSAHMQFLMHMHMAGASYLAKEHSKRVKDVLYVHKKISFRTGIRVGTSRADGRMYSTIQALTVIPWSYSFHAVLFMPYILRSHLLYMPFNLAI
jgi:hypothetical protein